MTEKRFKIPKIVRVYGHILAILAIIFAIGLVAAVRYFAPARAQTEEITVVSDTSTTGEEEKETVPEISECEVNSGAPRQTLNNWLSVRTEKPFDESCQYEFGRWDIDYDMTSDQATVATEEVAVTLEFPRFCEGENNDLILLGTRMDTRYLCMVDSDGNINDICQADLTLIREDTGEVYSTVSELTWCLTDEGDIVGYRYCDQIVTGAFNDPIMGIIGDAYIETSGENGNTLWAIYTYKVAGVYYLEKKNLGAFVTCKYIFEAEDGRKYCLFEDEEKGKTIALISCDATYQNLECNKSVSDVAFDFELEEYNKSDYLITLEYTAGKWYEEYHYKKEGEKNTYEATLKKIISLKWDFLSPLINEEDLVEAGLRDDIYPEEIGEKRETLQQLLERLPTEKPDEVQALVENIDAGDDEELAAEIEAVKKAATQAAEKAAKSKS